MTTKLTAETYSVSNETGWCVKDGDDTLADFWGTPQEQKENAHLFAAAPDLLDALQKLVWKAKDQLYALKNSKCDYAESSEYVTQLKDYISAAEAAIAKAGF